jgi:hypothetical protein
MSGLANLTGALYLAPRYGAMGMALARVMGEATLSLSLMCLACQAGLLTVIFRRPARVLVKGTLQAVRARDGERL